MKDNKWVRVRGVATPGGDPYYECPECGWGRCYGIEHRKPLEETCPNCGATLQLPDEEKHRSKG